MWLLGSPRKLGAGRGLCSITVAIAGCRVWCSHKVSPAIPHLSPCCQGCSLPVAGQSRAVSAGPAQADGACHGLPWIDGQRVLAAGNGLPVPRRNSQLPRRACAGCRWLGRCLSPPWHLGVGAHPAPARGRSLAHPWLRLHVQSLHLTAGLERCLPASASLPGRGDRPCWELPKWHCGCAGCP